MRGSMNGDQGCWTGRGIPRRRFLGMVGAGAALAALPVGDAVRPAGAVVPPDPAGLIMGVAGGFINGASNLSDHLPQLQAAGVGYIREGFHWGEIEYSKGKYAMPPRYDDVVDAANKAGIGILARLGGTYNYSHPAYDGGQRPTSYEAVNGYARYCEFVVRHLGPRVRLYEIWNEWDINDPSQGGVPSLDTVRAYVDLVRVASPRIKNAASGLGVSVKVLGPAFTMYGTLKRGFLQEVLDVGLLNHVDAVSFHMYNHNLPSDQRSAEASTGLMRSVQDTLKARNGGKPVPMYITEQGRPSDPSSTEYTEQSQAQYLTRAYLLARGLPFVEGIWWHNRQDSVKSNGYTSRYGLRRLDGTAKPSYTSLSVMQKALRVHRFDRSLTDLGGNHNPAKDHVLRFTNTTNGASTLAAWTTGYDHDVLVPFDSDAAEVTGMLGDKAILVTIGGKLTLHLTQSPKYVSAPLSSGTAAGSLVYETELLPVRAKSSVPHVIIPEDRPTDPNMSGGRGTRLAASAAGDYVTYTVNVPRSGTYGVRIKAKKWTNRGKFQTSVDGVARGAVQDLYAPYIQYAGLDLGSFYIPGGDRAFEFKVVGKNAASSGYELGLDAIILDQA